MNDGLPPPPPSLFARMRDAARGLRFDRATRLALAIALLLAAGPALTIAGARALEARVRVDIAVRERSGESRDPRELLVRSVARPNVGATIESLARALPDDARITAVERDDAGGLRVEVAAPDPDRVRTALRAAPETRSLRDAGQRGGDGAMIVTFVDRP